MQSPLMAYSLSAPLLPQGMEGAAEQSEAGVFGTPPQSLRDSSPIASQQGS